MSTKGLPVPKELRKFNSLFFDFEYKHDLNRVFEDFLTLIICCYGFGTNEELYFKTIKTYTKQELEKFAHLIGEVLLIYNNAVKQNDWVDPLGDYYEYLTGNYKKSRLGQYFTPKEICNLMAQLTLANDASFGKTINEPCSGSGRIVLAANQVVKGNYYVCMDLDPICAKMTAINLAMHGMKAEVHCMNYISDEPPYFSYYINYQFWKLKTPHIIQKSPA